MIYTMNGVGIRYQNTLSIYFKYSPFSYHFAFLVGRFYFVSSSAAFSRPFHQGFEAFAEENCIQLKNIEN